MQKLHRCRDCIYCKNIQLDPREPDMRHYQNVCDSDFVEIIWNNNSNIFRHRTHKSALFNTDKLSKGSCFKPTFQFLIKEAIKRGKNIDKK